MLAKIPIEILTAASGLFGATLGAIITFIGQRSASRSTRLQMLSELTSIGEVEKARIASYLELWKILAGASVREEHMTQRLHDLQDQLQNWYYTKGGGLLIGGGATKLAFFGARDLQSTKPYEIWKAFHDLGKCLRCDLRIFEDPSDEKRAIGAAKAKLQDLQD